MPGVDQEESQSSDMFESLYGVATQAVQYHGRRSNVAMRRSQLTNASLMIKRHLYSTQEPGPHFLVLKKWSTLAIQGWFATCPSLSPFSSFTLASMARTFLSKSFTPSSTSCSRLCKLPSS